MTTTTPTKPKLGLSSTNLEPAVPLVRRLLPTAPSLNSIHRWILRGTQGTRLPAIKVAGKWHTTPEAIDWFFQVRTEQIIASQQPVTDEEAVEELSQFFGE